MTLQKKSMFDAPEGGTKSYDNFYYAKVIGIKECDPEFSIQEKIDNTFQEILRSKHISWKIIKIENKEVIPADPHKPFNQLNIIIESEETNEATLLQLNWNSLARHLINVLLSADLKEINKVLLSVYTNKSGYAALYVQVNNEEVSWRYSYDELKKYIKKWKKYNDYSDLEEFLISQLWEIQEKIPENNSIIDEDAPKMPKADNQYNGDIDLPF